MIELRADVAIEQPWAPSFSRLIDFANNLWKGKKASHQCRCPNKLITTPSSSLESQSLGIRGREEIPLVRVIGGYF
jgi:hypothetical protein